MAKGSYRIYWKDKRTGKNGSFFVDADGKFQGMAEAVRILERELSHADIDVDIELHKIY